MSHPEKTAQPDFKFLFSDEEMKEFKNNLERKFATKVEIKGNEKKGKLIINYYTADDLDRIYEILN